MQISQPKSVTGLQVLDDIIDSYRRHVTSPPGDYARGALSDNIPSEDDFEFEEDNYNNTSLNQASRVKPTKTDSVIINLSHGLHSSVAASAILLYHLTALNVLPFQYGGKQSTTVYIDCSNSFSVSQLYKSFASWLPKAVAGDQPVLISPDVVTKNALSHVHILRCTSSTSLLSQLKELPTYLLDLTTHLSSDRPLSLVVVRGINHFHRQDKFDAEIARLENVNASGMAPSRVPLSSQILNELKRLQEIFKCCIIYTTTPTAPTGTSNTATSTRIRDDDTSPMAAPAPNDSAAMDIYARNALLNLNAARVTVAQFAPTMSLEECLRDKEKRAEAVRKATYWFTSSSGGLSRKIEGIGLGRIRAGFTMQITKDGTVSFE